jgi:hypothetical protein
MSCNTGEVYNDELKLINMNCLECKKEEDPNDPNIFIDNQIKIDLNCFPIKTYTEEKIIFDVSELDIEVTEKTCLDYGKAIVYGEYQCITKELNYYYVLNNDENTGVIDICDMSCESCNGKKNTETQDTNCINCIEGYYKTDDSNTNCILENLIPENYFKNDLDNVYYKCYFSCSKCSQLELDEFNHNCDKCISEYYFEYNTNNCYNNLVLERGYYLDNFTINENEDPIYKKCYEKCKTCNNTIIENNMNCILCIDGLYKINGTNNCFNEEIIEQGYYLKDNIFYPCEENCKTCTDSKSDIDGIISYNCLSCDITKGLYLVLDLNNCEPESFKENGYYLKDIDDINNLKIFYKCFISCSLCNEGEEFDISTNKNNHNCLQCANNYYPLRYDPNPYNCYNEDEMIPAGYILVRNYWEICHENCDTCTISPIYDSIIVTLSFILDKSHSISSKILRLS